MASPISDAAIGPLYYYNFASIVLLGLSGWLLKRLIGTLDKLQEKLESLDRRLAYIEGRDRITRLRDYGCPLEGE